MPHRVIQTGWRWRDVSPLSARLPKLAMRQLRAELPLTAQDRAAEGAFACTEDFRNAARAFLGQRRPVFEGR